MTAAADPEPVETPARKSRLPLILGLVLAVAGGAGGFMAVRQGLIGGSGGDQGAEVAATPPPPLTAVAYVALEPILVNLPPGAGRDFLRFTAQLEVSPSHQAEVEGILPRIVDVLNGYLRAVEVADLEDPAMLNRLRSQLLRRVQVVAGEGRVRDLLIMEFVLN